MANKKMKTLTISDNTYEIMDEYARNQIDILKGGIKKDIDLLLLASGWENDSAPYTYAITIEEHSNTEDIVDLMVGDDMTADQIFTLQSANIARAEWTNNTTLTLYAYGVKPSINTPVKIYINSNISETVVEDVTSVSLEKLGITATADELNFVKDVTSNIQTQLNSKQPTITGGASTIVSSNLTNSRALVSDLSGKVIASDVTSDEVGYLKGVTSAIQTQIDDKISKSGGNVDGNLIVSNSTDYSTAKTRNIQASIEDLVAGTSILASGDIYLVYE